MRTVFGDKYFFYILITLLLPINFVFAETLPNDLFFTNQEYVNQIRASAAWDYTTGSDEVIIAVIDTGVYLEHPDLKDNLWINNEEIPDDTIDNDNNGYIDDYQGWDFVTDTNDPNPKMVSDYTSAGMSHGTFIAGIIAAVGNNNIGITGISWNSKIMPLRVLGSNGIGDPEDIVKALDYAVANGADIVNFSLVSGIYDAALAEAIDNAYNKGVIIVAAAGNETLLFSGIDGGYDLNEYPFFPACYNGLFNNVIGVAALNNDGIKSLFSNYGSSCVDLSAPGENFYGLNYYNILMPEFRNYYQSGWNGTSMSAPVASGAAALVKSINPDLSNEQVYNLLIASGDDINSLNINHQDELGKRINLENLLIQAQATTGALNKKIIVSTSNDNLPVVAVYDLDGVKKEEFYAYDPKFKGGVNLTAGDVSGDWRDEIITGAGASGGPHLRVFDKSGVLISQFFAFAENYTGGINVTTIKYNGNNKKNIVVAPAGKHASLIKIFNYHGNLIKEFYGFPESYSDGLNLSAGDVNGDGFDEIIVSRVFGDSLIRIFDQAGNLLSQFESYDQTIKGVEVSVGDTNNDSSAEIITSPNNAPALIKEFSYQGFLIKSFMAFNGGYTGGVNLITADIDFDGELEVATTPADNHLPEVRIYSTSGNLKIIFNVLDNNFIQGLNIGVINY